MVDGCRTWTKDLYTPIDFALRFMERTNRVPEMVQPVMMPFSNLCHAEVADAEETLRLRLVVVAP